MKLLAHGFSRRCERSQTNNYLITHQPGETGTRPTELSASRNSTTITDGSCLEIAETSHRISNIMFCNLQTLSTTFNRSWTRLYPLNTALLKVTNRAHHELNPTNTGSELSLIPQLCSTLS